jgi:hypothetical protein
MANGRATEPKSSNLSIQPLKNSSQQPDLHLFKTIKLPSLVCGKPNLNGLRSQCQKEEKLSDKSVWHSERKNKLSDYLFP